jgi:recombination protein RecA
VTGKKVIEQISELIVAAMPYNELFIIDSTSACISAAALESGIDSERPMMDAKAWTKATQFMNDVHDPTRNTIIFIDQARTGKLPNGMFGGEQPPGGYALDHYSSITAKFTTSSWLFKKDGYLDDSDAAKALASKTVSGQMEPSGRAMKVRIEKSRVGGPFRTATLWFDFDKGTYEEEFEYMKWAKHFGFITGGAAGWYTINGDNKIQGLGKVKQWIADNPDFRDEVRKKVLEIA